MERKRSSDTTPYVSEAAGVVMPAAETGKPKRARAAASTPLRTAGKKAGTAASENGGAAPSSITQLAEAVGSSVPVRNGLDRAEIARLAYFYAEARGFKGGSPEEDWHRAEQELRARRASVNG